MQYVYGFAFVRLGDIADYSTNRIAAKSVDKNNYVGVDNLLADRQGKTESVYVPGNGNLIEFRSENTLIGNIRPYLKKIWFANCNGGTNGDVLVIKANEDYVMPKYLYYVLSSDKFFAFDMQYARKNETLYIVSTASMQGARETAYEILERLVMKKFTSLTEERLGDGKLRTCCLESDGGKQIC